MFCPFYGVLCKKGPSNLQNDDYGPVRVHNRRFASWGTFFLSIFSKNIPFLIFCPKIRKNTTKTCPSICITAIMNPLGSIIVVLQGWGIYLAQNPIKLAKRKNQPRDNYGPDVVLWRVGVEKMAISTTGYCMKEDSTSAAQSNNTQGTQCLYRISRDISTHCVFITGFGQFNALI